MRSANCPNCLDNRVDFPMWEFADTSVRIPVCADCSGIIVSMDLPISAMSDPRLAVA